jgi:uncharacterized lipoprotein YmbA
MTTDSLFLAFPNFVKSEPIEIYLLKELDETLKSLSSEPGQNEEILNEWLLNHENITDQLREFEEKTREVNNVKAQQPKTGVGNVFQELSEAVKQKLKDIEKEK